MADHVVTLTAKQEAAAAAIVAEANTSLAGTVGTLTVDDWIRDVVLAPVKFRIAQDKALSTAAVADAYDAASKTVQNQVKTILGI